MTPITEPRKVLHRLRNQHGARSPAGSRCSTAIENLQNAERAETSEMREKLLARALATLTEIAMIKNGAPAHTQIRPKGSDDHQ